MNFKAIGINTLKKFSEEQPEYGLGELLYSFLRKPVSGIDNISDLRNMSDEDIYTIIEKAKNAEVETEYFKHE